jgi:hypothetical protein
VRRHPLEAHALLLAHPCVVPERREIESTGADGIYEVVEEVTPS